MKKSKKIPTDTSVKSRFSHLKTAILSSVCPRIKPSDEEWKYRYKFFNVQDGCCIYCGQEITEQSNDVDHLHPVSEGYKGDRLYFTEISNLIPCCHTCNLKKGNMNVIDFYTKCRNYFLNERHMSVDDYNDRLIKLKEAYDNTRYIQLLSEDQQMRDKLFSVFDRLGDIVSNVTKYWGGYLKSGTEWERYNSDIPDSIEDDLKLFQKICDLLCDDYVKIPRKTIGTDTPVSGGLF